MLSFSNALLVIIGASLGALSRWLLGIWLNPLFTNLSVGTLAVNLIGCFIIGVCLALALSDSTKLLIITGFLGSFTTFSAFSADVMDKLLADKYLSAIAIIGVHTLGGVVLTVTGFWMVRMMGR